MKVFGHGTLFPLAFPPFFVGSWLLQLVSNQLKWAFEEVAKEKTNREGGLGGINRGENRREGSLESFHFLRAMHELTLPYPV